MTALSRRSLKHFKRWIKDDGKTSLVPCGHVDSSCWTTERLIVPLSGCPLVLSACPFCRCIVSPKPPYLCLAASMDCRHSPQCSQCQVCLVLRKSNTVWPREPPMDKILIRPLYLISFGFIWYHLLTEILTWFPTSRVTCQFVPFWNEQTWKQIISNKLKQLGETNACHLRHLLVQSRLGVTETHTDLQMLQVSSIFWRSKTQYVINVSLVFVVFWQSCWYVCIVCMCFSWFHCTPARDSRLVEQVGRVSKRACNQFQHRPYKLLLHIDLCTKYLDRMISMIWYDWHGWYDGCKSSELCN